MENDFIADAIDLPDAALELLDFGKIGREHREREGGVFTGFGYVEVYEDVRRVSEAMDFQPRKPAYTVLVNLAAMPLSNGEMPQILEFSQRLSELDARGELPKYKAILAANDCQDLSGMLSLTGRLDEYIFDPQSGSPEDVARGELGVILCGQDAETLLPHIDLEGYGRALLARDQAVITDYGLVERDRSQQVLEEQTPGQGGMEVM